MLSVFSSSSVWCTAVLVHSSSDPQAHASVQVRLCRLQEHLLEHLLIPHPHLTSSTTDSGAIAMSDRIGTGMLSASLDHPSLNESGIFGFTMPQGLDSKHMLAYAPAECVDATHQKLEGFYQSPWLALEAFPSQFFSCDGL